MRYILKTKQILYYLGLQPFVVLKAEYGLLFREEREFVLPQLGTQEASGLSNCAMGKMIHRYVKEIFACVRENTASFKEKQSII